MQTLIVGDLAPIARGVAVLVNLLFSCLVFFSQAVEQRAVVLTADAFLADLSILLAKDPQEAPFELRRYPTEEIPRISFLSDYMVKGKMSTQ